MAAPFGITTTASRITLDDGLTAEAAFTVLNQTGAPTQARAIVVADEALDPDWLDLVPPAERNFPKEDWAEQYLVVVKIPPGTAEGQYRFRVDAVAADRPDSEATRGPTVAFDVPYIPPKPVPDEPPGYLRTWLGVLIGALPAGIVAGALALVVSLVLADDIVDILVAVPIGLMAFSIAAWLGSTFGGWLALRMGKYPTPWRTAIPIAVIFPVSTAALLAVLSVILGRDPPEVVVGIVIVLALLEFISAPALGGRAWYRWRKTGGL
jgi:hypothetical protein